MYIADMFCFGKDQNAVGVNGIRGCMGVFVDHGGMLYGMHMPDSVAEKADRGRKAFAAYVMQEAGVFAPDQARMILVCNSGQRMSATDEGYALCVELGVRQFTLFRPEKFIPINGSEPSAIWVVCQRGSGGDLELHYRLDDDVKPVVGGGAARGGDYGAFREDGKLSTSTSGWYLAKPPNAHGLRHHLCT